MQHRAGPRRALPAHLPPHPTPSPRLQLLATRYVHVLPPPPPPSLFPPQGHGIFCNPCSEAAPAKLRLAFECAPLAFLIEVRG